MNDDRRLSLRARLVSAGLDPDAATTELTRAGLVDDDTTDEVVLAAVSEAASPPDALACLTALAVHQPDMFTLVREDPDWFARVVAVAGASRPLGDLLARYHDALDALRTQATVDIPTTAEAVEQAVVAGQDTATQAAGIATIRRRATAQIAARDLTGGIGLAEVAGELADLAEAVLQGTLRGVLARRSDPLAAHIAVIGMGKLGGRELNYVSDVDVVFVHEVVDDADDEVAARQATDVLTDVLELLNSSTTMGRAYEVDPTLRPEGRAGVLSRTVGSFVAYWERWAKTWELQALIKARPVAGDLGLGARWLEAAEPFVWPERLATDVVHEVREMKSRIEAKPEVVRHGERQLKLGPGGIRDIEFAVQLLQLVHGRADRTLRETGTLPTLRALVRNGYVDDHDAQAFADAYVRLRTVEHRLQLAHERRTHTIPDDADRQEWLARTMGYRGSGDSSAREPFLADLRRAQAGVRELHAKLFYRPLLTAAAVPATAAGVSLPGEVTAMGEDAAVDRLTALGFRDGGGALREIRMMTRGSSRRARTVRAVLPTILQVMQDTPDPDTGLASFRALMEAQGSDGSEVLSYLRDHPSSADLLGRVLGTSRVAGELLSGQPQGVDWLRDKRLLEVPRDRETLVRMALGRLHWQDTTSALRRFKRLELLRIVLRDLDGSVGIEPIAHELTALGDACLTGALHAELRAHRAALDLGSDDELPVSIAIIGMGKFGGGELHYVSDLDVLFVHEPAEGVDEAEAAALAQQIAGNVLRSLSTITAEGTAFEVDADLRPGGKNGPLSRSLSSYLAYWERWSEPWEHQALLRVRRVTGDDELGARFVAAAGRFAYPPADTDPATAMRHMKARLEKERLPRRVDPQRHLKLGPGGLSDVEWTVQLLQQRHGATHPQVQTPSTYAAIDALAAADLLDATDAAWLRDGYVFLSTLRNRLYLLRHRNVDVLPASQAALETLARAMGYPRGGWQELEEDRRRHARHVRRVCERRFYGIEPDVTAW